jgi:MATE family multidrug resistance protein
MVGATFTRVLRNSMLVSTAAYFALYFVLHPLIGNDALWLAFTTYMLARGVVQYFISDRLRGVYAKAD